MKTCLHAVILVFVMGLAFWAYNQNYTTQTALKETEALREDMVRLRDRLTVLRAEWAYLNRPDRLRDLANLNFDRLRLFPLAPEQFGNVRDIPFPLPPTVLSGVVEVRGALEDRETAQ